MSRKLEVLLQKNSNEKQVMEKHHFLELKKEPNQGKKTIFLE